MIDQNLNKNRHGELISRRDCLLVEKPSLDGSGRVLIIIIDFYSGWASLFRAGRDLNDKIFSRNSPKNIDKTLKIISEQSHALHLLAYLLPQ